MKPYFKIPVWEAKSRLTFLQTFYVDVVAYFNNSKAEWMVSGRIEQDEAVDARRRINLTLQKARRVISSSGVSSTINYQPPPAVGGYVQNVDVILNIFNIGQFQIPPETVTGILEQSIGVYTDEVAAAWKRTLNPFWWIGRFLAWFARIPFAVLRSAGFDADRAENSIGGKLVTLITGAIPLVAALLTIVHRLGYLEELKALLVIP